MAKVFVSHASGDAALANDPLDRACALTGGGPTPDEWDRHIPDLEYVDPCAT